MRKLYTESTTTYNVAVTATNLEAMKTSGPGGKAAEPCGPSLLIEDKKKME
jgi:hypothetical protein